MYKVLVVDDHSFIRAAVTMILSQEKFNVVGEASSGPDALELARRHKPDLIILDIAIPKLDGLEVISRIKKFDLATKILILTSQPAEAYANRCRLLGAVGYISKVDQLNEFRKALATVMSGYIVFPVLHSDSVHCETLDTSDQHLIDQLSDRELVVLKQLASGLNNLEIGKIMLLSNKTISAHKKRILVKLNLKSQVALADFARRNSLI